MSTVSRIIVWIGGGAFVASLALVVWWYSITMSTPLPFSGWTALAIDAALVTLFAIHHSLFARDWAKRRLSIIPSTMLRSFYVWVASLLLAAVVFLWQPIGGELYDVRGPRAAAHAAVQLFGLWLIARSVAGLDPLELAGIRQASHSVRADAPPQGLQVTGPYGWIRHPLYLGWMLALFGAARMTGDRFAFAALTSLYLIVAVPWEERSLRQSFGDDYARYAARVRWRIVPYVY
jgi:protein-S-isoprenylcysteine O-methyltransferase Ste14